MKKIFTSFMLVALLSSVAMATEFVVIVPNPKEGSYDTVRVNLRSAPSMKGKIIDKVESDGLDGDGLIGEPQKVYNSEEDSNWYIVHFRFTPRWKAYKPPVYISAEYAIESASTKELRDEFWRRYKLKLR